MTTLGNDALIALELLRTRSLVENDLDRVAELLDDELVYTHSAGFRDTKQSLLGSLRSGALTYHLLDHRFEHIEVGDRMAWASGTMHAELTGGGRDFVVDSLTSSVWIRRGEAWTMLAFHATPAVGRPE